MDFEVAKSRLKALISRTSAGFATANYEDGEAISTLLAEHAECGDRIVDLKAQIHVLKARADEYKPRICAQPELPCPHTLAGYIARLNELAESCSPGKTTAHRADAPAIRGVLLELKRLQEEAEQRTAPACSCEDGDEDAAAAMETLGEICDEAGWRPDTLAERAALVAGFVRGLLRCAPGGDE